MATFRQAAAAVSPARYKRPSNRRPYLLKFDTPGLSAYLDTLTGKVRSLYVVRDPRTGAHAYMYGGMMVTIPDSQHVFLQDPSTATESQQVALRMGAITMEKVFDQVDVSTVSGMARYVAVEFNKKRRDILDG